MGVRNEVIIHEEACTGCGVCVEVCPPDVLRMGPSGKAYVAYPDDCQACFLCVIDCAFRGAVEVRAHLDEATRGHLLSYQ